MDKTQQVGPAQCPRCGSTQIQGVQMKTGSGFDAADDPLEAKLFRKLKEAHDGGHLRVGGSTNPFGRGSLFYDDRALSRDNKVNQIRTDETRRYANAYASETREKMERMHGRFYSMEPRVDVTGGQRVTALFSRDQLDRMTTGNFSDVK